MNAELREQLRLKIVLLIEACATMGMRANSLGIQLVAAGFGATSEQIAAEVAYLADKELIAEMTKTVSPELKRWRITAKGRDFLAEQGLT